MIFYSIVLWQEVPGYKLIISDIKSYLYLIFREKLGLRDHQEKKELRGYLYVNVIIIRMFEILLLCTRHFHSGVQKIGWDPAMCLWGSTNSIHLYEKDYVHFSRRVQISSDSQKVDHLNRDQDSLLQINQKTNILDIH